MEDRLRALEDEVVGLAERVARIEAAGAAPAQAIPPARVTAAPPRSPERVQAPPPPPQPARRPARELPNVEDLLGGRVLAWLGGGAVLVGLAFFFALAISRGWIGEGARTLIAGAASAGLCALGLWLHDRRGRTDAAVAAVATGIAGLFMTVTVGSQVYEVIPVALAIVIVSVIGAAGTVLALRWRSQLIAGLGIVGCLVSPWLVGADGGSSATLAFLFVAAASAVGVLVWQRWNWLSLVALIVTTPQWIGWLGHDPSPVAAALVVGSFALLGAVAAVGYDVRRGAEYLRGWSSSLLACNALTVSLAGWWFFSAAGLDTAGTAWIGGLAGAHVGFGLLAPRFTERISPDTALMTVVLGTLLADVAFASVATGLVLTAGFAMGSVALGAVARKLRTSRAADRLTTELGLGAHLAVAGCCALVNVSGADLAAGDSLAAGVAGVLAVSAACFASARMVEGQWRDLLDGVGLAAVAYASALTLDGYMLVLAWTGEAVALATIARKARNEPAEVGALAFAGLAAAHVLAIEAPPESFVSGLADPRAGLVTLAALVASAIWLLRSHVGGEKVRPFLAGGAALTTLYAASVAIVSLYQPSPAQDAYVLDLGVREQGQLIVSLLWGSAGVLALVWGLRNDNRTVRLGALALLIGTAAKVGLYDLSTLTAGYRVASFVALGLLLLGGAFAWQRMRPKPTEDMRTIPPALR